MNGGKAALGMTDSNAAATSFSTLIDEVVVEIVLICFVYPL